MNKEGNGLYLAPFVKLAGRDILSLSLIIGLSIRKMADGEEQDSAPYHV